MQTPKLCIHALELCTPNLLHHCYLDIAWAIMLKKSTFLAKMRVSHMKVFFLGKIAACHKFSVINLSSWGVKLLKNENKLLTPIAMGNYLLQISFVMVPCGVVCGNTDSRSVTYGLRRTSRVYHMVLLWRVSVKTLDGSFLAFFWVLLMCCMCLGEWLWYNDV